MLKGVKNVILVLSGKGGVGKSTVSTQLALALKEQGFKTLKSLSHIDIKWNLSHCRICVCAIHPTLEEQHLSHATVETPNPIMEIPEIVMEKEEEEILDEQSGIIKHKKWTDLETRQLIALYKENENLWNIQSKDYGMKLKKINSIQTIADYFKVEPIEITRRVRSLRSQFNMEIKKMKQNAMKEESDEVYISTWSHFSSLLFLKHPDITDDIVQSFSLDDSERHSDEQENIHNEEVIENSDQAGKSEQKNDRKKWSDSEIRRLISLYRKNELLWNQQSKGYRNRKKKVIAVRSIAKMLKVKPDDVSRKLHNLRTQFCAELRKIKEKSVGQEGNYELASTWPYFSSLLFIAHIEGTFDGDEKANNKSEEDLCYSDVVSLDETFDESEEIHLPARTSPLSKTFLHSTPAKKFKKEGSYDASPYVLLQQPKEQEDAFGEFVASELRQLKNQSNKRKLKKIIMEAIANIAEADAMGNVYEEQFEGQ